ncbi:ATP-binding protein [Collinsella sp. zg1085]|uniref:ATP-binding protein n=1 Tax=Collinsella sp. zg1085 TaxID=2844380 RepID=UPI001C0B65B4|nr:ATP-binding protein [Collinsella sp. zg1085]QWT17090.1 ATP-binding protein [Collinsella sp. zg1085]
MDNRSPISLVLEPKPCLARLVRMTAANIGLLSSMSVDRIEDVRMAAEEAFIYACSIVHTDCVSFHFYVDEQQIRVRVEFPLSAFPESDSDDPTAEYSDLILASVCDSYKKMSDPAQLEFVLKADV